MAVDHHRRRIGPPRAQLADAQGVAVAGEHLGRAAGGDYALAGPLGRALQVGGVAAPRGDGGDAEPVAELVEERVCHGPEAILQPPATCRPK